MKKSRPALLCSCEHGGYKIPRQLRRIFTGSEREIESHRGWDQGALIVARDLAQRMKVPLIFSETSRLVVDLNRSEHHPKVFSSFTRTLPLQARASLLSQYYHPYRRKVLKHLKSSLALNSWTLHLSIHSFTPKLNGVTRSCDIGLLYDPKRHLERTIARSLKRSLHEALPSLRVRMNYPYKGTADGLTTALRKTFSNSSYAGIEIELNQALFSSRTRLAKAHIPQAKQISICLSELISRILQKNFRQRT